MPLLKAQKIELAQYYKKSMETWLTITALVFDKIPVNEVNNLRIAVAEARWLLQVVKKRVFLKAVEWVYDGMSLDVANASVMLLYSFNDEDVHAPLKVVQKFLKNWKKDKKDFVLWYIGGRYEKDRKNATRITELASLPSKEELVGKFLFLLNHPVSSFARALQAISDKKQTD